MKKIQFTIALIFGIVGFAFAQQVTQSIKGRVLDKVTQTPIVGANIVLADSQPLVGTTTDFDGLFTLDDIPVGRHSFVVSMLGYETHFINEYLVTSGKQVVLNILLEVSTTQLNEVIVVSKRPKSEPINSMATLSSRQFTVEETQRFAGGLDDPARLVSSFAGVTSPSINNNGISVRGNSPSGLLWRIEGVEIPSPNHFADLEIAGSGALTVLSNHVMGNSDFYTSAFPAEYGNATSGVFDINLRSGNSSQREYTFQAGILGLDFATEGPFKKGKDATYLVNYRYSTLGLIGTFLPNDAGILKYQDLSYKVKLAKGKFGTFSLWGIGGYDSVDTEALSSDEWESADDREDSQLSQYVFASGVNHKIAINAKSFLNTTLALSGNGISFKEQYLDDNLVSKPVSEARQNNYKLTFQSFLNTYFSESHYNRTGLYVNHLNYDMDIYDTETPESALTNIVSGKGNAMLFQLFTQSKLQLSEKLELNAGLHSQYFQLNKDFSVEPRIALKYQLNKKQNLAMAFGSHTKTEALPIYFVNAEGRQPNKKLKLMKSNHLVFSFNSMINEYLKFSIEHYYQQLTNVPVSPTGYISTINLQNSLFFDDVLVSNGKARTIGVDLSLERYINKGLYYMLTASLFDSNYIANDGIKRNTRFNKNYAVNALIGKEWQVGKYKNNLLGANIRFNYLGGNRIEPIDMQSSLEQQDVVYGEINNELAFTKKTKDLPITSFSLSFRKNKPKYSSIWSLQVLNSSGTEEFDKYIYNINKGLIESNFSQTIIPNLSYRIEF